MRTQNEIFMKKQQGFTLLEVMVALLVVAVALGGSIKVISNAATNANRLNDRTFAHWVALNQIAELRITNAWPKVGAQKGDADMADRKWVWEQESISTDDENIRRIEVSVWPENDTKSPPFITAVGFLPKP